MNLRKRLVIHASKIFRYEFWPYHVFYFPMLFYGLYLALKARSFTYYTTTNPSMKYGGIMGESKFRILQMIPSQNRPETIRIKRRISLEDLLNLLEAEGFLFPFVAKPDMGERGYKVEVINDKRQLEDYLKQVKEDFLIQEYIPYPLELGILYYKIPGNDRGTISSIVLKEFLALKGNGKSTVLQLLEEEVRAVGRKDYLKAKFSAQLHIVLPRGEKLLVEPIGNHCRGTTFLNGNYLINKKLTSTFDKISNVIPDFYYGRFDIKVPSLEDLYAGKNIKILELNGVSSEPAHIYDPDYSLWRAYADVRKHMKVIYCISRVNRRYGLKYAPFFEFMRDVKYHLRRSRHEKSF